jgi:hypothetical protein
VRVELDAQHWSRSRPYDEHPDDGSSRASRVTLNAWPFLHVGRYYTASLRKEALARIHWLVASSNPADAPGNCVKAAPWGHVGSGGCVMSGDVG